MWAYQKKQEYSLLKTGYEYQTFIILNFCVCIGLRQRGGVFGSASESPRGQDRTSGSDDCYCYSADNSSHQHEHTDSDTTVEMCHGQHKRGSSVQPAWVGWNLQPA